MMGRAVAWQRGSVSLVVAAAAAAILLFALALGASISAGIGAARAQAIADLSALTAAQHVLDGHSPAHGCRMAAQVSAANGASLRACGVHPDVAGAIHCAVILNVDLPLAGQRGISREASAAARG